MRDKAGWYPAIRHAVIIVLAGIVIASFGEGYARAGGGLSFGDWLARQGTRCKDLDGDGVCCEPYDDQYIPANRSYVFWGDSASGRAAVVDYLGISASYLASSCGVDLGTTVHGTISAYATNDGRLLVSVQGQTKNALAYVVDGFDPRGTLLFGSREADVCSGAAASVASVAWQIEYYTNPATPIADNQWFGNPPPTLACETASDPFDFRFIALRVTGVGTLADGSPARLTVIETGTLQSHSLAPDYDGFPVESINLYPVGR